LIAALRNLALKEGKASPLSICNQWKADLLSACSFLEIKNNLSKLIIALADANS
jgi:hypothetical protein